MNIIWYLYPKGHDIAKDMKGLQRLAFQEPGAPREGATSGDRASASHRRVAEEARSSFPHPFRLGFEMFSE